jgi:pyruvate formate lyase activating enzyme
MRIGGFQKFSLSDFPGHPAAIVFTQGCNFRCPFCHNGDLIPETPNDGLLIPEDFVLSYLRSRAGKLDGLVVTGGEPTLQPDLASFLSKVRKIGYRIKVDTNGSRPDVLELLISGGLVDFIAMDVKAPARSYDRLTGVNAPISEITRSIGLLSCCGIEHEFRTTHVSSLLSDDELDGVAGMIPDGSTFRLQTFNPSRAFDRSLRTTDGARR